MKERTYQGTTFVANSAMDEFLKLVLNSFLSFHITAVKDGLNISGENIHFKKDNIAWNSMICDSKVIYFEKDTDKQWIRKPIIGFFGRARVKCVVKEEEEYLIKESKRIEKILDIIIRRIDKNLGKRALIK